MKIKYHRGDPTKNATALRHIQRRSPRFFVEVDCCECSGPGSDCPECHGMGRELVQVRAMSSREAWDLAEEPGDDEYDFAVKRVAVDNLLTYAIVLDPGRGYEAIRQ